MVLSDSLDDELPKIHEDLCNKLNLDPKTTLASWDTYESISKKYVLEGEKLQWLGCAIYAASQGTDQANLETPSNTRKTSVNLTSLLKHSNLSFVQFFSNITRWADMVQLSDDFRSKINHIRSNFSVSYNTFKKFHPLFSEIFVPPAPNAQDLEILKNKSRRPRTVQCTSLKIFEFIWNLFTIMKAEEPTCSQELIKSHHLLYCCIDLAFKSAVSADLKELLNPNLAEEVAQYNANMRILAEVPCIVKRFCCDSVIKEALHMKAYMFKQLVLKLIESQVLIADQSDFTGIFDPENFDRNFKNVIRVYEHNLATNGDFDERLFLAEYKRELMEKDQSSQNWTSIKVFPPGDSNDLAIFDSPKNGGGSNVSKGLDTPLTGRRYLGPREDLSDKTTTEKVARLQKSISNRSPHPSKELKDIFKCCQNDPLAKMQNILSEMIVKFNEAYTACNFPREEAEKRANMGCTLFYKYVELILKKEMSNTSDISALVEKDIFYQCMLSCCMEIILHCYNFPKKFPWILEVLEVEPVHFVKVIELIVRAKDNLFRELIKHLNRIEESVIESLAWKSTSPIWDAIEKSGQSIPKFQDTALPGHLLYNDTTNEPLLQSPGGPSATDCFQSPLSQLCRNLFPTSQPMLRQGTHIMVPDTDGNIKLIPIMESDRNVKLEQGSPGGRPDPQAAALPRRTGSLSIIFRKFYNLAGVRMQHLCSNLGFVDFELKRKIWTIFEDSIRYTDLIKDRHLDQLLMCAIYVICKAGNITKMPNLFAIIMKSYRQQPQASSSVYRDVLIEREKVTDNEVVPEVRGDLIQFYNSVYVKAMQTFAIRFQPSTNPNSNIILSPLPATRRHLVSPNTQVVRNVFVKPLDTTNTQTGSTFNYYFSRSPSKDLKNINRAINNNGIQGKRLLIDEDAPKSGAKRLSNIQSLVVERQRQNASE